MTAPCIVIGLIDIRRETIELHSERSTMQQANSDGLSFSKSLIRQLNSIRRLSEPLRELGVTQFEPPTQVSEEPAQSTRKSLNRSLEVTNYPYFSLSRISHRVLSTSHFGPKFLLGLISPHD